MRALIQRVQRASIDINQSPGGSIAQGLVIFLGITHSSEQEDARWLAEKILKLKLFEDENTSSSGQQSIADINGGLLIVSQFTLHASTKRGTKPSFHRAAPPDQAEPIYDYFVEVIKECHAGAIITGDFGAHMDVHLTNDGPVTIMIDSKNKE